MTSRTFYQVLVVTALLAWITIALDGDASAALAAQVTIGVAALVLTLRRDWRELHK